MKRERSIELFQTAQQLIPGGVNSPVRAFKAVGGQPIFMERGSGCMIYDVDGNGYIDYVLSWGPMILGHAHPAVTQALIDAAKKGTRFGALLVVDVEPAPMICEAVPSM